MRKRPLLLDLFSGAGDCAMGYYRAGFDVVGVDNRPQPHYPFRFIQADALLYLYAQGRKYDAVHASPPCQGYSKLRFLPHVKGKEYPMLVGQTLELLRDCGRPWVVENVEGAPLEGIVLCGAMFGLRVYRHRLFQASVPLTAPDHPKHVERIVYRPGRGPGGCKNKPNRLNKNYYANPEEGMVCVAGNNFVRENGAKAMGIDWHMKRQELTQAIPPAYTEHVGRQLLVAVRQA